MPIVTLQEAKDFCRISFGSQDTVIQMLIDSSTDFVEDLAGVQFKTDAELSTEITEDNDGGVQYLFTNQKPVRSIVSIAPSADAGNPIDASAYVLDGNCIRLVSNGFWTFGVNRWRIVYTAGYGDTAASTIYPPQAKHAILEMIYRNYNNRGSKTKESGSGISVDWGNLLDSDLSKLISSFSTRSRIF